MLAALAPTVGVELKIFCFSLVGKWGDYDSCTCSGQLVLS